MINITKKADGLGCCKMRERYMNQFVVNIGYTNRYLSEDNAIRNGCFTES